MPTDLLSAHILLVDDSLDELRLLKDVLDVHRFRMSIAFDGHQGYQRAKTLHPDLILLDVRMPKMDGFSACRLLKADPLTRDIPVIFLSAANAAEERLTGLSIGGVDYVNKPFLPEEVLARVRIHLSLSARMAPASGLAMQLSPSAIAPDEVLLQAGIAVICQHLGEPITVDDIASSVGSHEKKLSAVFKERTGLTVFAYLREERLRVAKQWLEQGDTSVQMIAEQLGFQNAGNFSTAFRERFGLPPTAYRKLLRQGDVAPGEQCA
ncbi:AraC family two component transcriptional regulator [Vogesella indigofera]|uniref:AraC family two component transcriptional regulator n=1 Tax=Vogesella indigofera TaxID=45465 RepID=A0A495BHD7_VOGIN|nr:response regulator [Vogesella indigofera]RKQ60779.1 AraC family two component transcriptional regulator [Vogesella indigofera]